jgi:hypothetical protein
MLIIRDTCECMKDSLQVRSLSLSENVPLWKLSLNFKTRVPPVSIFNFENHSLYSKQAYMGEWKRFMYPV